MIQDAEIDRILKAFKLDAYAVLDLKPGVPESDIKKCYRVKSLLIHPDKTSNPQAPEAFDRLKKAQTALMDEKVSIPLIMHVIIVHVYSPPSLSANLFFSRSQTIQIMLIAQFHNSNAPFSTNPSPTPAHS